jgi:mono/diheme cytochrome c family protein
MSAAGPQRGCPLVRIDILFRRFTLTLPEPAPFEMSIQSVRARLALSLAGLSLMAVTARAQDSAAANGERPTSSGVFTEAQAARGEGAYKTSCQSCHAKTEYTGDKFKVAWVSKTAFDIFDVIRTQMPEDNPGSLERAQYVDIVAYIFSLNAFPVGSAELPGDDDALKKIRIVAPPSSFASDALKASSRAMTHPRVTFRK